MKRPDSVASRRLFLRGGFSLIELLVVLAIMALLVTLAVPSISSILESLRISQALNILQGDFSGARQYAVSANRAVEVRLCRSSGGGNYRFVQVVSVEPNGAIKPVGRARELPVGVCLSAQTPLSSLASLPDTSSGASDPVISGLGSAYYYKKFRFYPSGATDLSPNNAWFATLVYERNASSSSPPPNFATLQVDPVNGLLSVYRP